MVARLVVAVVLVGCYDVPQPDCGFACGPGGACPDDYTCKIGERGNLCMLSSSMLSVETCAGQNPDTTSPIVLLVTPADGATNVDILTSVVVEFNEDVRSVMSIGAGVDLLVGVGMVPLIATSSSQRIELQPMHQLLPNTPYVVRFNSTLQDTSSNPLVAFATSFTTGVDLVPPQLVSGSPEAGEIGVGVGDELQLQFSESVVGVTESTLYLEAGGNVVPAEVSLVGGMPLHGDIAWRLNPRVQLAADTTYTVHATPEITDNSGNALVPAQHVFTTGADTVRPRIVARTPSPNAIDVSLDAFVAVVFDEQITGIDDTRFTLSVGTTPVPATVVYDPATRRAVLTPATTLEPSAQYTVAVMGPIQDAAGNIHVAASYTFTTVAETTPPP